MDENVLVQELVNRLTFEVEPLGADDVIISPNRNGTPLNVKVRVRNKDEPKLIRRGVVPHPRAKPASIPDRIQLIGSDQTIISFNVFMEATTSKESSPGSRKRGFHFFKLGGCLGTSYDEDDGPYLPGSSNKEALRTNRSSKSASLIMGEVEKLPDRHKFNSIPRNQKGLFGQCKPGGCLDPPFDEDKYPYSLPKVQPGTNLKQPLNKIEDKINKRNAKGFDPVKTPKELNEASKAVTKNEDESKPVLSPYPRSDEEHPITSQYSNSIITYPPNLTSSQTQNNEQSMEKKSKNKSFDCGSPRSSYEYPETYFIPPKDVIRQKEEERRYSKELSNDEIKFDDDDRNKDKISLGKFRPSIDRNSTSIDRFRDKERTKQEIIKQTDIKIPDSTYLTNKKGGENKENTDEGPESSKEHSNYKKSNRQIEIHDTYPGESGRRFAGNEDDVDELETMSYDINKMKGTRRFGGNEGDIDTIPHDTDTMKGPYRFGGNVDEREAMPQDTNTIKGTRRFGKNEDDIDKLESKSDDTMKGTRRFGVSEDDIDQPQPTPHDTGAMKGTRRFGRNEDDIDKLEPTSDDTDTMIGTQRFGEIEDDIDLLEPKRHDTDMMMGTSRFGGMEYDIDKLEVMPHDTDTIKGTRKFDGNEDYINKLEPQPHDTDTIIGTRRFGGIEDDIDKLEPTSDDTDTMIGTQRFGEIEDDIDLPEPKRHDTDMMMGTSRFGGMEYDIDKLEVMPHDTDTIKGTRKFDGNEDDIEPQPHDTDTIIGTRRFGGIEDDIDKLELTSDDTDTMIGTSRFVGIEYDSDKLEVMPHDTDTIKVTRKFEGNEDDIDKLEPQPHETDTIIGRRRFGGIEYDIDKPETMPHDKDTIKGTQRFGVNEDNIDQPQPTLHDTDAMKGTRRFGGNEEKLEPTSDDTDMMKGTQRFGEIEDDIDILERKPHDTDTIMGTRRFGEIEDDIDKLEPTSDDTDTMIGTSRFVGMEYDIDKLEVMPHDTDTIKDTRRFGGNEDDIDKLEPQPHDTDTMKDPQRFGGNEDNIDQLEPMPHNTDTKKGTRRFHENEGDIDEQEAIFHDIDTMKGTRRFGGNEDDIDKPELKPSISVTNTETTSTTAEQNSKSDEASKDEQISFTEKNAMRNDGTTNDDQVLLATFEKLHTPNATKDDLSSDSILSENKEFATSSIESINSGEHLTNDKLKEEMLNSQTKDLYSEKVSPTWENIHNEMLPKRRSSAIFQKTPFVEITHDEISKPNPLRRNTFTIIDSRTSLQKQIEEISTQRNVTKNLQVDNGNMSIIVETKTYFEPSLRILSSDTEVNVSQNTRSLDSPSYIHDVFTDKYVKDNTNLSRNNPNAEQTELHEVKNSLDIQKPANPTIDNSLFENSTKNANITLDAQSSTARDHADEKNDVYGFSDIGDIPPDSGLKDELVDKTIKEKTNNAGANFQDATLHENLKNFFPPDKTIVKPKVLDESKTILVNLSFQSYVDANEKRVIQTLNPLIKPHPRYKDDTITVFQSYINHGNEIRIPVNPQHDLILNLLDKNHKLQDINKDHAEEKKTGTTNSEDILKKNLAVIYETGLIPLYSVIKDLIEEINTLSAQQELLKAKVGRAERSKSLRLIPVNNRCGCRRN